jgi:methylated-DNA-[protein]-cysteine S-methyltransferase
MHATTFDSPIGVLRVETDGALLTSIAFLGPRARRPATSHHPLLDDAVAQLEEYFAGDRTSFELPLARARGPFEQLVREELLALPYGTTTSYGAIAKRLGRPDAARAVGLANAANPIAIVVPCHRVIGADGSLTGYAGGLDAKRRLLELESGVGRLVA